METPWEISKACKRQAFCLSTEALRFSPEVSWRAKQSHTLQWTCVPQELRPCLNLKGLVFFHPVSLLGNRRKISFCTLHHQYNKISPLVLSVTHFWQWHYSLLLFSHYSCWSSLCRDIKGRTGCGKLNCLNLPSAWCYPPAVNKNIAESFTAEQAFYFLLIELQKEKMLR